MYRPASSYLRHPAPPPDPYSPYSALFQEPPQIELPDDIDDNPPVWRDRGRDDREEEPPRRPRSPVRDAQYLSDEALARQLQLEEHRRAARAAYTSLRYHLPAGAPPVPYPATWRRGGRAQQQPHAGVTEEDAPVPPLGAPPMPIGGLFSFLSRRFSTLHHQQQQQQQQRLNPLAALMFIDRDFNENDYEMLLALDETTPKTKGATPAEIEEHLKRHIVQPGEEENCAVCLEEMAPGDEVRKLNCRHMFHFECISKWLLLNKVCPIDKRSIDE
jgi:hypothetical protein